MAVKSTKPKSATKSTEAQKPEATVVTDKPVIAGPLVKKPELVDRVVEKTGMKKKDVKPVVEAALAVLGDAIAAGEELNLPPLGKVRVNRTKELAAADVYICKIRRSKSIAGSGESPLAAAAE